MTALGRRLCAAQSENEEFRHAAVLGILSQDRYMSGGNGRWTRGSCLASSPAMSCPRLRAPVGEGRKAFRRKGLIREIRLLEANRRASIDGENRECERFAALCRFEPSRLAGPLGARLGDRHVNVGLRLATRPGGKPTVQLAGSPAYWREQIGQSGKKTGCRGPQRHL